MDDQEIIREFLIESNENLARLDQEMVILEQAPKDPALLASVFRTIHTIKGTCGFLGFTTLESITHIAENILSQVRNEERSLTPQLVSLILDTVDAIKSVLVVIEATNLEGDEEFLPLRERLTAACSNQPPSLVAARDEQVTTEPHVNEPPAEREEAAALSSDQEITTAKSSSVADSTIRVDVGLLDKLMNLVGELVLARNQILQVNGTQEHSVLNATSQRLNLITTELQEGVMRTRMQPIGVVWSKLPRLVRDLAAGCGKQIHLEMDGAETELDKTIIEAIKDPLTHIVRNACDHGLESPEVRVRAGKPSLGTLTLRAFHEGGHVNIEILDDGGGINVERVKNKAVQKGLLRPEQAASLQDRDAVNLVFLPGFSTAEAVTSISGRGVGMDVVKTNIEKIGGTVELLSRAGAGTTVRVKIPLTLAIIPGLVVTSGEQRFIVPQASLLELVRLEGDQHKRIEHIHGTPVFRRRGALLPLTDLRSLLEMSVTEREEAVTNIVVLQAEDRQFGLVVDNINDTQEIVVKPLSKQLKGLTCYSGATIMGDGKVALILDVRGVAERSGLLGETSGGERAKQGSELEASDSESQSLLLFRCGAHERVALPLALVARLEEIPLAQVEYSAGRQVIQYRDRILNLVSLADHLSGQGNSPVKSEASEVTSLQVIVIANGENSLGLIVDEILDVVDEKIAVRKRVESSGLLGSAVVGEKVTDILDLQAVIRLAEPDWFVDASTTPLGTVLVWETSAFTRGLLRSSIEMAGYKVVEAVSEEDVTSRLSQNKVDAVLAGMRVGSGSSIAGLLREHGLSDQAPIIGLVGAASDTLDPTHLDKHGMRACEVSSDREGILRSLENLMRALGTRHSTVDLAQSEGTANHG